MLLTGTVNCLTGRMSGGHLGQLVCGKGIMLNSKAIQYWTYGIVSLIYASRKPGPFIYFPTGELYKRPIINIMLNRVFKDIQPFAFFFLSAVIYS